MSMMKKYLSNQKNYSYTSCFNGSINSYRCGKCKYKTVLKVSFFKHMNGNCKRVQLAKMRKCPMCCCGFNSKLLYDMHKRLCMSEFLATKKTLAEKALVKIRFDHCYSKADLSILQTPYVDREHTYCLKWSLAASVQKDKNSLRTYLHSSKIRDLVCQQCKYRCTGKETLIAHVLRHKAESDNSTDLFTLSTFLQNGLIVIETDFHCVLCSYKSIDEQSIVNHLGFKHTSRRFACTQCELTTGTTHLKIKCQFCSAKFCSHKQVNGHILEVHTSRVESDILQCDLCDFKCCTEALYCEHLNQRHAVRPNDVQLFKCADCNFTVVTKEMLMKHMRDVHEALPGS